MTANERDTYTHEGENNFRTRNVVAFSCKDHGADAAEDVSPTLRSMNEETGNANAGGQVAVAIPLLEVGKRVGTSTDDPRAGIGIGEDGDPMHTLQAGARHGVALAFKSGQSEAAGGIFVTEDYSPTLQAQNNGSTAVPAVAFKPSHYTRDKDGAPSEIAPPLSADADKGDQEPLVLAQAFGIHAETTPKVGVDVMPTLRSRESGGGSMDVVAFEPISIRTDVTPKFGEGVAFTMTQPSPSGGGQPPAVMVGAKKGMQVRRLTPLECERLQGFPDNYTLIPVKKVRRERLRSPKVNAQGEKRYIEINGEVWQLAADGPRYKALGNSMAVPVMRWIGKSIARAHCFVEAA